MLILPDLAVFRDVPYRLPLQLCHASASNSCLGKHYRYKAHLEQLGWQVRWAEGLYRWADMPLPAEILDLPHDHEGSHVWLQVLVDGVWCDIDISWDAVLVGRFPIASAAVGPGLAAPLAFPVYARASGGVIDIAEDPLPEWQEDLDRHMVFFAAINDWLDSLRATR